MFSGIITQTGKVKSISTSGGKTFTLNVSEEFLSDVNIGDSISINGACQTVTKLSSEQFTFFSSIETLKLTNLDRLKVNDTVNLEKSISLKTLLHGHLVMGHVDTTAPISEITKYGDSVNVTINIPQQFMKYVVTKGSIAIDGISLTITEINNNNISVTVIPHTFDHTTLKFKKVGNSVNLEFDILAKYIEKLVNKDETKIGKDWLISQGF